MAKIITREERMRRYNRKYPVKNPDAEQRIRDYFDANNLDLEAAAGKASEKALRIIDRREYESIDITMYEYPMQTDRPRVVHGHAYSPGAAQNRSYFRRSLGDLAKVVGEITTPTEFTVDAYLEMPPTVPPDEVILFESKILVPESKPDADNIGKSYMDMVVETLLVDDDIVHDLHIRKWYSLLPRVEIRITYLRSHESDYLYGKLRSRRGVKEGLKTGRIVMRRIGEQC